MTSPTLAEIWIYPIKSLDGVRVESSGFTATGSLEFDRQWALFDANDQFVNGKREPRLHLIRSTFATDFSAVTLQAESFPEITIATSDLAALSLWFSEFLGRAITVRENTDVGFPDDLDSPGPTIISQESLAEMATWFPGLSAEDLRRRLRPNLVLAGLPPFGEDAFFGPPGTRIAFCIGSVQFFGNNPCQRCVVPARDPVTSTAWPKFQIEFARRREASLPEFVDRGRFTHFYRAAVNTLVPQANTDSTIRVGDELQSSQQP